MTWMSVGQGPVSSCGCRIHFYHYSLCILTWTDSQRDSSFLYYCYIKSVWFLQGFCAWTTGMGNLRRWKRTIRIPRNHNTVHWRFIGLLQPEGHMSYNPKKHLFGCPQASWTCESTNIWDLLKPCFLSACVTVVRLCFLYSHWFIFNPQWLVRNTRDSYILKIIAL